MNFWELLRDKRLGRLLRVRWTGQVTDGIFQSALASFILFSPERQANALNAAIAFTVVLLPYSIVGPFLGTILDRISRQRAIVFSNLTRACTLIFISILISQGFTGVELTIFVLLAFGVNRLILAGLSAGIPLVVDPPSLISANALAVTGGSICVVIGGGIGLGIRRILDTAKGADSADAILILVAAFGFLAAAFFASLLKRDEIGPRAHEIVHASISQGFHEMRDGFKFLEKHTDAARGIIATAIHRGGLTALVLTALLLERNSFHDPADNEAGLSGLSITLSIAAIGFAIGAFIAPFGVRKLGRHRWMRLALLASAIGPIFLVFARTPITLAITAFLTALCGQNLKVTNDALVQSKISDEYRGRVFSVYDVVVNAAIIIGALGSAILLPVDGDTAIVPLIVCITYLAAGFGILRPSVFTYKTH